ncbi:MAG TPA: transcriptional repressor [Mycobacteriales bacterium]|nr:transcriptional repressor [Mycobacteriales bacterium]
MTTKAQRAVLEVLDTAGRFLSAQDIHARLRHDGSTVGLTSVYRALQSLTDEGSVDVLRTGNGETTFRRCDSDAHHHHLVCRRCGATVEVEAPGLERWLSGLGRAHSFVVEGHTLEVVGLCARCTSADAGTPAK